MNKASTPTSQPSSATSARSWVPHTATDGYSNCSTGAATFGTLHRARGECTGSYGVALTRLLRAHGVHVIKVNQPDKATRRREARPTPSTPKPQLRRYCPDGPPATAKSADGPVEMIRMFKMAKASATKSRTQAINQLKGLLRPGPRSQAGRAGHRSRRHDRVHPTRRATTEHKLWWVHRKKTYGINLQALADERGNLLWLSAGLPGANHDLNAARQHDSVLLAGRHRVRLWADKGYIGCG